ncbi:anthranilate synthase component I family protein [Pedobacter cryoconitis]|uniref:Para-aminobenzoate synthetase component 1 n=1 Tax=Pedobacter cryoconitis TaxID=188932 RepID=A0A327S208_9SPHI|nr:anthranilate synthase component I family protein [Pedobacter cryoconitis]RAJ22901.1 para-aminobenzoate synthetase component 1 [Pedobacter cryoconitis]
MNSQELISFKQKALQWANQFEVCCCFDSNEYTDPYSKYDFLLAAGTEHQLNVPTGNAFKALKTFAQAHPGWLFGLLSYDLKNEIEELNSGKENKLDFPDLFFFAPKYLIAVSNGRIEVLAGPSDLLETIHGIKQHAVTSAPVLQLEPKMDRVTYLAKVNELRDHIARGDIYEVNFCQEFFAENAAIDPYEVYLNLNKLSPTPFSGFFKVDHKYILSASPERFLCKRGNVLTSQPIKGTAKRSPDVQEDEQIKIALKNNIKEQAENVMIVDLVRNDLTKSAVSGTVKVKELFGIYSFPQLHQMISTISCQLKPELHPVEAIENAFPMGSMTGAPKVRAMELIEDTECSRRGIYSGAFGYFDPEGDFDFNVVIRSILYNEQKKYLSFQVGGAITFASSAEAEYEECMLKASAMIKTLKGSH